MLKVRKAAILFFIILVAWSNVKTLPVYAADNAPMIGIADEWDNLEGDAQYLGQDYRNNYNLDQNAGKLDLMEKAANGLANVFWKICTLGTQVGCAVIYYAMDFNLAEVVGDKLNALESTLVTSVFNRLFPIAFIGVGFMLVFRLLKRDVVGGFSDIAKATLLVCISIALSINASSILTLTSSLTKQVNQTIMSGINGQAGFSTNEKDFAREAAGILWTDMIHIPWMTIEFGNNEVSEADVQRILASKGEERTEIIDELADEFDCFSTDRCWERLAYVLLYLFPWVSKLVVFSLISALQLAFQAAVLLLFSTAPIVLIIALISASGLYLIKQWGSALLDFHIDMIMLSFLLSILIWIDKLLFTLVNTYGWLIVALLQTAICVFVFLKRNKILGFLIGPRGHGVQDIVEKAGNKTWNSINEGTDLFSGAAEDVKDSVHDIKDNQEESIINAARSTSFSDAYNTADYVEEEQDTDTKYNSSQGVDTSTKYSNTQGVATEEVNDSEYRKEPKTMTPQEVYQTFQGTENADDYSEIKQGPDMKTNEAEEETEMKSNSFNGNQPYEMDGMDEDDEEDHADEMNIDRPNAYMENDVNEKERRDEAEVDTSAVLPESVYFSEVEDELGEVKDTFDNKKSSTYKDDLNTQKIDELEEEEMEYTVEPVSSVQEKVYELNEDSFPENNAESQDTAIDSNQVILEEIEDGEEDPKENYVVE